ncbi:MAG TPA: DUF4058 family protein [Anaerolineae bacterium]
MPSPFPGMDPYLDDPLRWPDVHQSLITYIRDALQSQIRPDYLARIGERVYMVSPARAIVPDVFLVQRRAREVIAPYTAHTQAPSTLPIVVTLPPVEQREPFIEIVHAAGEQIVTVIEVLSPANKAAGEGRAQYRQKQQQILASRVNFVEIDLLASGQSIVAVPDEALFTLPAHRYIVSVHRAVEQYRFEMYPLELPRVLPQVRVPLRDPDPDVSFDLQAVFTQCYDNGGYADLLDYRLPPRAPLSAEEAAWVNRVRSQFARRAKSKNTLRRPTQASRRR